MHASIKDAMRATNTKCRRDEHQERSRGQLKGTDRFEHSEYPYCSTQSKGWQFSAYILEVRKLIYAQQPHTA